MKIIMTSDTHENFRAIKSVANFLDLALSPDKKSPIE